MDPLILPLIAILVPIVIVPTALGIKYARQVRELEHRERIRALELGRVLPGDEPWANPARVSLAIAVGVPISVFLCAGMATTAAGFREEIWIAAMLVGMTAVVSGSILAGKHFAREAMARSIEVKPAFDADAYDTVGTRG